MEDFYQFSVFDIFSEPFKIDKPIRLIELFAGIGSQAKALERIGADFEHYRVCEFDKYAIKSYNAIHGTNFSTSDITQLTAKDLGIVDTNKYCYIMTYSFPCQDLSLAGKQKGMAKGENTRSGLLWEVERLLNECSELPQVLLMENVTQVHGKKNKEHFDEWIAFLESKGYSNYWKDLNSKNFGIPQNRNRTFMVSVLGNYTYEFPKEFPLQLRLKHLLEDSVDEKYYISNKGIECITKRDGKYTQICDENTDIAKSAITAVGNQNWTGNFIKEPKCQQVGMLTGGKWDKLHDISRRVYSGDGVSPTIHTCGGGNLEPKVIEPRVIGGIGEKKSNGGTQWYQQDRIYDNECAKSVTTGFHPYYKTEEPLAYDEQNGYIRKDGTVGTLTTDGSSPKHNNRVVEDMRIRKLTPKECWRLMGFDDADFEKAAQYNSNSQLYKQAGNSIVVDVLAHIFTQLFRKKTEYSE